VPGIFDRLVRRRRKPARDPSAHIALDVAERNLVLSGRLAAFEVARKERIRTLADAEFRVFSQWGEDGIIEWLCCRLPDIPRRFVEFGVETYREANTRFLLEHRAWAGLVMDASAQKIAALRRRPRSWRHDLVAIDAFVTAENIDALLTRNGFSGELGVLSIDIDGNDYWILNAVRAARPWIIICEINAVFGDRRALTIPYRPDFNRRAAHPSGLYFGASVLALARLCAGKGYRFIGTNMNGVNAFFVRDDIAGHVLPAIGEVRAWPSRHREGGEAAGAKSAIRGPARAEIIGEMPVVDLDTGATVALRTLYPLYSDAWLSDL
jgi:hypothetical protein